MNAVGRQMQRSGSSTAHHQRQYSDNFLDTSSNGRWLQSSGLQHLQSLNPTVPGLQDREQDYGGGRGGQGSRMYMNLQRSANGGNELYSEPSTPPVCSWSSSQRKNGEEQVSPNELSPGILDLHSFDTELLPETWRRWNDGTALGLLDQMLSESCSRSEVMRCIHIGLLCVQENVAARPTMASIVLMLGSYSTTLPLPSKPSFTLTQTSREHISGVTESDQSTSESKLLSVNEASITELSPR